MLLAIKRRYENQSSVSTSAQLKDEFEIQRTSVGGSTVIFVFNSLIFLSSFSRAMWFLLPDDFLFYINNNPRPFLAFEADSSLKLLTSEIILQVMLNYLHHPYA
jgi:hypothetical protein